MPDDPSIEELRALRNEIKDLGLTQRKLAQRLEELEALLALSSSTARLPSVAPDTGDIVAPRHKRLFEDEPED
jgi:hypothetical protein